MAEEDTQAGVGLAGPADPTTVLTSITAGLGQLVVSRRPRESLLGPPADGMTLPAVVQRHGQRAHHPKRVAAVTGQWAALLALGGPT